MTRTKDLPETVVSPGPAAPGRGASKIAAELAAIASPGSAARLDHRTAPTRCGRRNCGCHADPPRLHGPYLQWTRKIGGKTVTRRLTPRELAEYQPLFDNAKKLRALVNELQDLTLEIIEADSLQKQSPEPET